MVEQGAPGAEVSPILSDHPVRPDVMWQSARGLVPPGVAEAGRSSTCYWDLLVRHISVACQQGFSAPLVYPVAICDVRIP